MRSALHPNEYKTLCSLNPQQQMITFSLYWTLKEALLKGKGVGIADPKQPMNILDFSSIQPKRNHWIMVMDSWVFVSWIYRDSYIISIAVEWESDSGDSRYRYHVILVFLVSWSFMITCVRTVILFVCFLFLTLFNRFYGFICSCLLKYQNDLALHDTFRWNVNIWLSVMVYV